MPGPNSGVEKELFSWTCCPPRRPSRSRLKKFRMRWICLSNFDPIKIQRKIWLYAEIRPIPSVSWQSVASLIGQFPALRRIQTCDRQNPSQKSTTTPKNLNFCDEILSQVENINARILRYFHLFKGPQNFLFCSEALSDVIIPSDVSISSAWKLS